MAKKKKAAPKKKKAAPKKKKAAPKKKKAVAKKKKAAPKKKKAAPKKKAARCSASVTTKTGKKRQCKNKAAGAGKLCSSHKAKKKK